MVLNYLKEGEQSEAWLKSCSLVDELLWSVNPQPVEDGARAKLLQMIPGLMARIREGLKEVSYDEFKAKALLKSLEDLHVNALQTLQTELARREIQANAPAVALVPELPAQDEQTMQDAQATIEAEDAALAADHQLADTDTADELSQRQRELAEQEDAIADLVRSTMELEMDFKNLQNASQQEATAAVAVTDDSAAIDASVEGANSKQDSSVASDGSETLDKPQFAETEDHSESEEIVLVSMEPQSEPAEADQNDPFVKQVEKFAVGCWFEFQSGEQTERCKLAAVIKATGKYIFVNRAGVKVAEKTKMGLAVELRRGSVQILNDGLLFDRALESIITNLRGKNTSE